MIEFLKFIFLGFIQGITEPIPVSSSGHLLIFQHLLEDGLNNIDFEILATMTNFGSLIAVALIYKDRLIELIKSFFAVHLTD